MSVRLPGQEMHRELVPFSPLNLKMRPCVIPVLSITSIIASKMINNCVICEFSLRSPHPLVAGCGTPPAPNECPKRRVDRVAC